MHAETATPLVNGRRAAMSALAASLWYVPGSFEIARVVGLRYSLRCVLFHHIAETESVFTKGLGGTITRESFEATLRFLTKHYTPVSLEDVLASFDGRALPPRPVLVTFDDGYASVSEVGAPLCLKFGVPAVVFVNASGLDNRQLVLDNLICYVANVFGLDTINIAIQNVESSEDCEVRSLAEVFGRFLPHISLSSRKAFRKKLLELIQRRESELASEAGLYLSSKQLRDLATFKCEIGNHTYTHVNCRSLAAGEFAEEIDRNRTTLELVSGKKVRSFSVPYGSFADLTPELVTHLQQSGYEAAFLAGARANSPHSPWSRLDRVSIKGESEAALFSEIEILPRLRSAKDGLLASKSEHALRYGGLNQVALTNRPEGTAANRL